MRGVSLGEIRPSGEMNRSICALFPPDGGFRPVQQHRVIKVVLLVAVRDIRCVDRGFYVVFMDTFQFPVILSC